MEAKYFDLLDDETIKFITRTEAFYPADAINAPIEKQREYYNALCREFDTGYPEGVTAKDRTITDGDVSFQVRDYVKSGVEPRAHVLFFHGGGFVVGGLESHDSICAEFCDGTNCLLTSVDYRMAPEYLHPASFQDCLTSFNQLTLMTDLPIVLAGDSAGGNLAAAVAHAVREHPKAPIGQLLIYPGLGGDQRKGSYVTHANAPMLTVADIDFYKEIRSSNLELDGDPAAAPLHDNDFQNLPHTVAITAECDPLSHDGKDYCEAIVNSGGKAIWIEEEGLVHGYLRARTTVSRAEASFKRMIKALNMLADRRWDY